VSDAAARARAHRDAVQATICDRVEPWEHGTAVFASEFPSFYAYNGVRLQAGAEELSAEDLVAVADRMQAGLGHRQVEVEDRAAGERLRPGFAALGWHVERNVWMELEGPARDGAAGRSAELLEVPFARTRPLRAAWFATSPWAGSPAAVSRFMAVEEAVAARRGTRALLACAPGGEAIGFAAFSLAGGAAEVELVDVVEAHRNRGTGGALVRAAVAAAGAPRTWIVADDEGDAKRLYERLGFVPAWIQHVFTRA
jgi:GNAT superfamily N-acetyltransferase